MYKKGARRQIRRTVDAPNVLSFPCVSEKDYGYYHCEVKAQNLVLTLYRGLYKGALIHKPNEYVIHCLNTAESSDTVAYPSHSVDTALGRGVHADMNRQGSKYILIMITDPVLDLTSHYGVSKELLDQECTQERLETIADQICNWKMYACALQLSPAIIQGIDTDLSLQYEIKPLKVLKFWLRKQMYNATYYRLIEVSIKCRDGDIVAKIFELLKGMQILN